MRKGRPTRSTACSNSTAWCWRPTRLPTRSSPPPTNPTNLICPTMTAPLVDAYDLVIFDLDGVIYLIDQPIPGAVEAVTRLAAERRAVAYATNNASRRATEVAELLAGMGVPATAAQVLTSAGAAAALLAERFPAGTPVLVVGSPALHAEVRA